MRYNSVEHNKNGQNISYESDKARRSLVHAIPCLGTARHTKELMTSHPEECDTDS